MVSAPARPARTGEQDRVEPAAARGQHWRQRLNESLSTTPGRLTVGIVVLAVLGLLFGLVAAVMVSDKQATLEDLANRREPVSTASQEIYRSLSDADATAASVFLAVDTDPAELRKRYYRDIAQAGAALSVAATNSTLGANPSDPVRVLVTQLPVYSGIIETAQANNRLGYPVGAAYLREASGLMRATLLPAAENLYLADQQRLNDQQDDATSFPWFSVLVLVLLVLALIYAQRYLSRHTNRTFNVGLVAATVAVAVAFLWSATALAFATVDANYGRSDGSEQVQALADARIAAVKARANETLALVARSDGDMYNRDFERVARIFGGADGSGGKMKQAEEAGSDTGTAAIESAMDSAKQWLAAHDEVRKLDDNGRYREAVAKTVGSVEGSAGAAYYRLDGKLSAAIDAGRDRFVQETTAAANSLFALAIGIVVLALIAAGGATVGIWQRLQEYR